MNGRHHGTMIPRARTGLAVLAALVGLVLVASLIGSTPAARWPDEDPFVVAPRLPVATSAAPGRHEVAGHAPPVRGS